MKTQARSKETKNSGVIQRNELVPQKTAVPAFLDNRKESKIQQNFAAMANGVPSIQLKSRIDWDNLPEKVDKEKLKKKVQALRDKRHAEKLELTKTWASRGGQDDAKDSEYNDDIASVRKEYEEALVGLAEEYGIEKKDLISGDSYYGDKMGDTPVYRRSDVGKEYVKDDRGTFVPRYIRRELNFRDKLQNNSITTQGIKSFGDLKSIKGVGSGAEGEINWPEREYLQQSIGGGGNLFALSHTATKRPILSNAHKSFGARPDPHKHSGAIITDLAKMGGNKFSAQWGIDPVFGHKVPLNAGVHTTLDRWSEDDNSTIPGSGALRDEKVRSSGYRNMEVVAEGIPRAAHSQPDDTWKTHEGPKTDYHGGVSRRGQKMLAFRQRKQLEVLAEIKAENEQKKKEELKVEGED